MAPNRSQTECPSCHRSFDTTAAVVRHLNHPYSSCTNWFIPPDSQPDAPSSPIRNDPEVPPPVKFPSAGHIFGQGQSFMSNFHADKFAEYRAQNIYYPFASRGEWELGAFLTQANMSMKVIDEFLSLESVSIIHCSCTDRSSHLIARYVVLTFPSGLRRHSAASSNSFPVDLSGFHRKFLSRAIPRRIRSWFITVILSSVSNGSSRILYTPTVFIMPQNAGLPPTATVSMRIGSPAMAHGLCRYAHSDLC